MHKYLRISKQQASSSGGRYQFGHQVNTPYQIKANIFDSTVHHPGSNSVAASAMRQRMVDFTNQCPKFQVRHARIHTKDEKGVFCRQQNKVIHGVVVIEGSLSDRRKMYYGGKKQDASEY